MTIPHTWGFGFQELNYNAIVLIKNHFPRFLFFVLEDALKHGSSAHYIHKQSRILSVIQSVKEDSWI